MGKGCGWGRAIILKAGEIWGKETKKPLVQGVGGSHVDMEKGVQAEGTSAKAPWPGARVAAGAVSGT